MEQITLFKEHSKNIRKLNYHNLKVFITLYNGGTMKCLLISAHKKIKEQ